MREKSPGGRKSVMRVPTGRDKRRPPRADPACILVTGASSGIGAALARFYARPGRELVLWGRDAARLELTAETCRAAGAAVRVRLLDLAGGTAALLAAGEDDRRCPIDLAILAAGLGDMRQVGEATERPETVLELGLVNFATTAALATLFASRMGARGGGRIVLLGSVAAFHDLPYAPAYAGSKAGIARFATALRLGVQDQGVGVVLISPGFIDTPMSRRVRAAKPFLLSAERAARLMGRAIAADRAHLVLPWQFNALRIAAGLVPPPLLRRIMRNTRAEQEGRPP